MTGSADLLRRAAVKLREHADAATPSPWVVEEYSHGYDDGNTWNVLGPTDEDGSTPIALETNTDDAGFYSQAEADVSYAALMHPSVALALADLLDAMAPFTGRYNNEELRAVARAILRESEVDDCPDCGAKGRYDGRVHIGGRGVYICPNGHRWQDWLETPSDKGYAQIPAEPEETRDA